MEAFLKDRLSEDKFSYENIKKFTIDLTEQAKNNNIDPIIGRENEIKRSIQVLSEKN